MGATAGGADPDLELERQVSALALGSAGLDLGGWTVCEVGGADAEIWLDDLVTASARSAASGEAVHSLLLSPTGRIRAEFHLVRSPDGFVLVQAPDRPAAVAELLAPYVLSSDVVVRTTDVPYPTLVPVEGHVWRAAPEGSGSETASFAAFEAWRIRRGIARFPVDLDEDSLAAEASLDVEPVIDRAKGCYLGQEAVAKVRNLGHPPRVVLAVRSDVPVSAGVEVLTAGEPVGVVTSATALSGGSAALVRVRWGARDAQLSTREGVRLLPA